MNIDLVFILKTIIIGIVEGITEFLPISSTGHMVIVGNIIGFKGGIQPASLYTDGYITMFEVVIQLGAILAIIVLYWDKIVNSLRPSNIVTKSLNFSKWLEKPGFKFWLNIVVAAIPAVILGKLFKDKIEHKLLFPLPVAAALIVGAILIIYAENKFRKNPKTKRIDDVNIKQALVIGIFQCLALWPGMSRSASTIIGAWIVGLSTVVAAEFSFFLAIPMMFGASLLALLKLEVAMSTIQIIGLAVGFIVSFIVALIVVEKFIKFLQKRRMRIFAVYRILVGVIIIGLTLGKIL